MPKAAPPIQLPCRAAKHRDRKRNAERACGLEIDFHLNFRDLLNGQIGRQFTLENLARVGPNPAMRVKIIGAVAHKTSGFGELSVSVDGRYPVARRQRDQQIALGQEEILRRSPRVHVPLLRQ